METDKPFESERARLVRENRKRLVAKIAVFEDMMQAADDGEFSREEAIAALNDNPFGFMKEEVQ